MRPLARVACCVLPSVLVAVACGGDEAGAPAESITPGAAGKAGAGGAQAKGGGAGQAGAPGSAGKAGSSQGGKGGSGASSGGAGGVGQGGVTSAGGSNDPGGSSSGGTGGSPGTGGQGPSAGAGGSAGTAPGTGGTSTGQAGTSGTGSAGAPPAGPTCAQAGGDRCGKTKADCAGLVSFASSDCVSCCTVPKNPVIDAGFADPFIVREGDTYYAFATGGSVRRRSTKDFVKWTPGEAALDKAAWKDPGSGFWAPAVYKAKNGKWILYYATETNDPNDKQHCIGKAVANQVTGDFQDKLGKPFICGKSFWSIDPSVFQDKDGKDYLLWRQDTAEQSKGNVFIQRLDENGDLMGASHQLISRAKQEPSWEFDAQGGVLENPAMVRNGNLYHLFYSGNRWETAKYANGHATCEAPFGPCKKTSTTTAWQGSKGQMLGPGGADTVEAKDGTLFMYMHGWDAPKVGDDPGAERKLWLYRLDFNQQKPSISAP